jgi:hypothetical protein
VILQHLEQLQYLVTRNATVARLDLTQKLSQLLVSAIVWLEELLERSIIYPVPFLCPIHSIHALQPISSVSLCFLPSFQLGRSCMGGYDPSPLTLSCCRFCRLRICYLDPLLLLLHTPMNSRFARIRPCLLPRKRLRSLRSVRSLQWRLIRLPLTLHPWPA